MKELTVEEWWIQIEKGLEYRRKFGNEKDWQTMEEIYNNTHHTMSNASQNLIMSTGDTIISNLSVPYPMMVVTPRSMDSVDTSPVVEAVDNLLIETMDMQRHMEDGFWAAYLFGRGIYKIGYDSQFGYTPSQDVRPKDPLGMTMSQFGEKNQRIEFGDVTPGMPWIQAILPHDFIVPYGTGPSLSSAEWCVHRIIRHIDDVKEDEKYENTSGLQPNMNVEDFMAAYSSASKPYRFGAVYSTDWSQNRRPQYVELWEIHDRRTGKVYVIATGYKKFLRNEPDLLQIRGLPFVSVSFMKGARTFWTTSFSNYLLQSQLELSDISVMAAKERRTNIPKMIINEDAFDKDELDKLASSRVRQFVLKKGGVAFNDAVMQLNGQANQQVYLEKNSVRDNVRETVGLGKNQVGEYEASGRHTAFEAKQVADASGMRMDRRQLEAKRVYVDIFRLVNAICGKWWKTKRLVQILDQNSIPQWVAITGAHLQGEYSYELNMTTEGGNSASARKQMAVQLYPILAQDPTVDPVRLRQWFVRSMSDKSFSSIFDPKLLSGQMDPQALQAMIQSRTPGKGQGVNQEQQLRTQNSLVQ